MFYLSRKEKPYWYKAQRVKTGFTTKGEPYTFIDICHKDKQDNDKYKNATIIVWGGVDVKQGDSISIHSISGFSYKESESGFKKYISMQIITKDVMVKAAGSDVKKEQAQAKPITQKSTPANEELYGGVDDEALPF